MKDRWFMSGKSFVKPFTRKALVSMITVLMAATLWAGGSGQKNQGAGSGERITLTISRWAGPHADDQKTVIKEYVSAHPNITVIMDDIDNASARQKQLLSVQKPAGQGDYDLMFVFNLWTDEYVQNGYLLPLDDMIKEAGLDMSIYNPEFVAKETFNGKLYAFPARPEVKLMTYNTEWLKRDGKTIPKTLDEIVELAKFYKAQGTGISLPARQGDAAAALYAQFLYSAGGDFYDPNTGRLSLDSEAAIWAGELWKELCQNAIVGSLTWHTDEASQAIREEKAPFGVGAAGLAMLDGYSDRSKITDKAAYTAIPGKNKVVGVASYFGWGIARNSAHPKEAFEFARWLVSPETEKKQSLMNGQTSCVTANATDPEITSKYPFSEAILESMKEVRTIPGSVNAAKMILRLQAGLSEIGSSNKSAREVLSAIQAEFAGVDMRN